MASMFVPDFPRAAKLAALGMAAWLTPAIFTPALAQSSAAAPSTLSLALFRPAMPFQQGSPASGRNLESRSVKTFGALCDGIHDDTRAIQDALAATMAKTAADTRPPVKVLIPDNCVSGPLHIGSNQWIEFAAGATLHAARGAFPGETTPFLAISSQHDVTIIGNHAAIAMNSQEYTGGEWRAGIYIYQSRNVHVEGLNVTGAGGDGFTIKGTPPSENVQLVNVSTDNCARNGISIITGRNITVDGAVLRGTRPNGRGAGTHGPWAGLDIEPNGVAGEVLENITIRNVRTSHNGGAGLQFTIHSIPQVSIAVSGFQSEFDGERDNGGGLHFGGVLFASGGNPASSRVQGQIVIESSTIQAPNGSGVLWRDWPATQPQTVLRNMTISNPGAQTGNMNRCGLYYNVNDRSFGSRYTAGRQLNVVLDGIVVNDDRQRMVRAAWLEGDAAHPLQVTNKSIQGSPVAGAPSVVVKER